MEILTAGWLIRLILGAVLGAAAGTLVPGGVRKLLAYKCGKRGKPVPDAILTGRTCRFAIPAADALLTALTTVFIASPAAAAVAFCILQIALVCVFVDWYVRIIANEAIIVMLVLGLLYRLLAGGAASLLGSLEALCLVIALFGGCAAVMTASRGNPGVGAGDLKYAMVLAISVGWPGILYLLLCFAAAVLIYIFAGMKMKMLTMKTYFPMCLHLSVGLLGGLVLPALGIL